jgi:acylphosphatase
MRFAGWPVKQTGPAVRYNRLMRIARRFVLSGRVQGVGYRYFAQDAARREGLHGFVRNHDDGSVEAVAEGEAESLERFERALRQGPSRSRVERVLIDEIEPALGLTGFVIR